MLLADGAGALLMLGLWIFCLLDVITTDAALCRNLPKPAWLLIVVLLPDVGSVIWLVAGHQWQGVAPGSGRPGSGRPSSGRPSSGRPGSGRPVAERSGRAFPEYDRPGRAAPASAEDDDAFLAQVRAKAEAQRADYTRRRAAELEAERRRLHRTVDDDS